MKKKFYSKKPFSLQNNMMNFALSLTKYGSSKDLLQKHHLGF